MLMTYALVFFIACPKHISFTLFLSSGRPTFFGFQVLAHSNLKCQKRVSYLKK
eukprot:TRINITY_DN6727_c0_g1_i1.p1 TRINITY_DN6727_c0_g1~~TRINITY_DN6727_c0_g1_i1.p1  ORF type:complete len:53 (+),score=1.51 TRINITY_DN6727_c0_g1_i1:25-183(+)